MYKLGLENAEGPEIKLPKSIRSQRKQGNARKNIYFCFTDYAKAFDCVDHNKLWKILKEMGIPDHLLRNLYASQEATGINRHETIDCHKIWKGVHQSCLLLLGLSNFYAKYIMRNAGLDESQARIKIARRNSNNLRYADDTILMAKSEEELKSPLRVKESEKAGLKLNIKKGWMPETSARAWCSGKTQRVWVEREVGGGIGMGNTCKSMADSCQCMTKPTTTL